MKNELTEIDFGQEKLNHIIRYAAYAERCAIKCEIPITFKNWKEIYG